MDVYTKKEKNLYGPALSIVFSFNNHNDDRYEFSLSRATVEKLVKEFNKFLEETDERTES